MINGWKVIWLDGQTKKLRRFEGESPRESGAIAYGKRLQARGFKQVNIVSQKKAFAPPRDKRQAPETGMLWCPYCLKWRFFVETAVQNKDGRSPVQWRCPICSISIQNFYVRRYNLDMVLRFEGRAEFKQSEQLLRRRLKNGR